MAVQLAPVTQNASPQRVSVFAAHLATPADGMSGCAELKTPVRPSGARERNTHAAYADGWSTCVTRRCRVSNRIDCDDCGRSH